MRCGLHYVRFCDLRTKQCAGAPATQAATKSFADALAGGPLTRRKVHAFAKHPSGSRPGAPGARLPSDLLDLDPTAPRPLGPASAQAREEEASGAGGRAQDDTQARDGEGELAPAPEGELAPPIPGGPGPGATQEVNLGDPGSANAGPGAAEPLLQGPPLDAAPGAGRPQGLRALLGLEPSVGAPAAQQDAGKKKRGRKPGTAKAANPPKGRDTSRARATSGAGGPPVHPAGRIVHWLRPGGATPGGPQGGATVRMGRPITLPRQLVGLDEVPSPKPGEETGYYVTAPGSSTDPPQGSHSAYAERLSTVVPGSRSPSPQIGNAARRAALRSGHGSQAGWDAGDQSPSRAESSIGSRPRVQGGGRIPLTPGFVPDFFVPFPGGGGRQAPPRRGRRGTGQLEPD